MWTNTPSFGANADLVNYGQSLEGANSSGGGSNAGGYAAGINAVVGMLMSMYGAYSSIQSTKRSLEFQSEMAKINARMAEQTAQSILFAGGRAAGQVSLKAGKVKGAQRASQGARGIVAGEGSAAEEIATTELMKETDMLTINANATREAWAARTQSVNARNEALLKETSADTLSPLMAAGTSLLNSGTAVASSWYQMKRDQQLVAAMQGRGF
jgi:hypothetical protein